MLAPESAENVTTIPEANEPRDWDVLLGVLDETMQTLRDAGIPFLLFVRPENAKKVLELLGERGYTTKVEYEHWLYKAFKHDVLVDVIFRSSRDILLDEEMLRRARTMRFRGREVPVAPPEDLMVMKAIAASEDTPRYWYDAIAIIAAAELDWDYVLARARQHGARRILSLLLFADSVDLVVPRGPIETLYDAVSSRRTA
jgi:Uncharacterised nucleotidyltransferase